jgi:hypothetical protein
MLTNLLLKVWISIGLGIASLGLSKIRKLKDWESEENWYFSWYAKIYLLCDTELRFFSSLPLSKMHFKVFINHICYLSVNPVNPIIFWKEK